MDSSVKELVTERVPGKEDLRSNASVTPISGKSLPESLYRQAIAVNGQVEFEEPWSLPKKLFGQLYFAICMLDTLFVQAIFFVFVWPFLGRENPMKRDPRKRPVSFLFYMPSTHVRFLKENATTWRATEYIYTWNKNIKKSDSLPNRIITSFLGHVENIISVRNRMRSTKQALYWEIYGRLNRGDQKISITSVAAGSARAIFEVVASFLFENPDRLNCFEIILIDGDIESLAFARKLATEIYPGLEKCLLTKEVKVSGDPRKIRTFLRHLEENPPDIVEMVGLIDYKTEEKAINIISAIYSALKPGGVLITNNAKPNVEQHFLKISVSWVMKYKSEAVMELILSKSGFRVIRVIPEPCNIHPIYLALKEVI